ncbi:MAG TPA: MGMT family protein [Acidimicrobiales bacterium]|nr:MGMT family protein [Acidimicrobiales bacterium]
MAKARPTRSEDLLGASVARSETTTRDTLILERIRAIPEGFVRTYGDIYPLAPRLVGRLLATTNEELPWHRVVRADGTVAKGTRQLKLLTREGVPLIGARVDLRKARLPH